MSQIYVLELIDENLPDRYTDLLFIVSKDKRERIEKYKHSIDKKLSLYSDVLVRYLACQTLRVHNHGITFSTNEYGKPYLFGHPSFKYNISHTRNAAAIAISDAEIGIDIEKEEIAHLEIAKRFFTADEAGYVFSGEDMNKRFYEVWTKKEAYIKWLGKGLNIPLNSFSVLDASMIITSFEIGEYIISVCPGEIELPKIVTKITENQLIAKALGLVNVSP